MNFTTLESSLKSRTRRELELPEFRRAAVLVPVVLEPEPQLILTVRTAHLPTHKGQISFPGGSLHDLETPIEAALREAHEEIGLDSSLVNVLGMLDDVWTPQGFHVTPVLGLLEQMAQLEADANEVAKILHVPLEELKNLKPRYEARNLPPNAKLPTDPRAYRSRSNEVLHFDWQGFDIWGMTAWVISDVLELL
jgi:8-oxo-dGTP pyrophosphatase MutT (NUDIX family)